VPYRGDVEVRRIGWCAFGAGALALALAGCGDDGGATAPPPVVEPADAVIAVIEWHADEIEPVLDDSGEPKLPVIYVASLGGDTIDVGIQAAAAERTVDIAIVRFADDRSDAVDSEVDGMPVKDDGVMLLLGEIPEPARIVEFVVARYRSVDHEESMTVEIVASSAGASVRSATPN
jgi:hypothetical protein